MLQKFFAHKKAVGGYLIVVATLAGVMTLLLFFQPTNVVANLAVQNRFLHIFGMVGLVLSLPLAFFLVKSPELRRSGWLASSFQRIGFWGTRFCVVLIVYFIFAFGGFVLPKHWVHFSASETYKEELIDVSYRLAYHGGDGGGQLGFSKQWYWYDEYLHIVRKNGQKEVLLINNTLGINKLNYSKIEGHLVQGQRQNIQLVGRKHPGGFTYDALQPSTP